MGANFAFAGICTLKRVGAYFPSSLLYELSRASSPVAELLVLVQTEMQGASFRFLRIFLLVYNNS